MASTTDTQPVPATVAVQPDEDDLTTSITATENTPLLGSETASSHTVRDGSPPAARARDGDDFSLEEPLRWKRAACIILSMWALIFLQASNMSGMTMTQGRIAADLDAYEDAMWFTSSYLITTASVAPVVGRLAMIFSPGLMLLISSSFFALGAIVASQAHSFAVFVLGRVLIGVGGGGIMTLALILVIAITPKQRRGLWIGVSNAGFTIGLSTGAVVYGALLPVIGWRALFWLQAPIGILAGFCVFFGLPAFRSHGSMKDKTSLQKLAGIDYAGAVALTITIVLFLYGLSNAIQPIPILLSLATFAAFLTIEYRLATDPIIPLSVLQNRGVLLSCLSQLGFMASRWTLLFYAPIFVLAVRGLSPAIAGSVLIPTNLGFGTGGLVVGWLHVRRAGSFWLPCVVALVLFTATLSSTAVVSTAATPAAVYLLVLFLNGLCTGAALNYTLAHLLHLAAPETHFVVTGLLSTFRGFAGSFGTAIGGGIFARTLRGALTAGFEALDGQQPLTPAREELIKKLLGTPGLVFNGGLSVAENQVAVAGYEVALRTLYRSAGVLCLLVILLQAGTGWAAPVGVEEEEVIEEEVREHGAVMEA